MARVIVVTSGKGGVGKSTIVSCLGRSLAMKKNKVALIDADLGLKNLDVIMGLESRIIYDLEDVIKGRATLRQALVQDKMNDNLYLLPACLRLDVQNVDESYIKEIINQLQDEFDYIIIDSPAGIEKGFVNAVAGAKEAIIVVTLDKASLRDADKVVGLLRSRDIKDISLIINKFQNKRPHYLSIDDVNRVLGLPILGIIDLEKEIIKVQNYGLFLSANGNAQIAFNNIANRLSGVETIERKTFFSRFIKKSNIS